MPGKESRRRRRLRKRELRRAEEDKNYCQAFTEMGGRCSRIATVVYDLTQKRAFKIGPFTLEHSGLQCCSFCTQHATMLAATYGLKLSYLLVKFLGPKIAGLDPTDAAYVMYPTWSAEKKRAYGLLGGPF